MHELDRDVLSVSGCRSGREDEQLAALVEPQRHRVCGTGDLLGLPGELAPRTGPALEGHGHAVASASSGTVHSHPPAWLL
jgi:hypothetical protein